jgi:hypothetical protein
MKLSHLLYVAAGVGAGLLLAPKAGLWNRYITRKTKEGQNLVRIGIKKTEVAVADAADGIIDMLETGRKSIAS